MSDTRQRRVLIVEGNPDGHRLYYLSLLASAAIEDGNEVFVATTERAISSSEWRVHVRQLAAGVAIHQVTDFSLEAIEELSRDLEIDHVVVPDGDSCAYEIAKVGRWLGHGTIAVLVMRELGQPASVPGLAKIKTIAKRLALQRANRTSGVEIRVLKSSAWRGRSALPVSLDPVSLTRHETGGENPVDVLQPGIFWFGIVGNVDPRKNLPLVASAIASLNVKDVGLVVAGQVRDSVLESAEASFQRIRAMGGRVMVINRLLEDSEFDRIIIELDCVVLAHSNEGPSGILGKAVAAGTRIVAAGAATLRADCKSIGPGAEWTPLDERLLSASLGRALRSPCPIPSTFASTREFASGLLGAQS